MIVYVKDSAIIIKIATDKTSSCVGFAFKYNTKAKRFDVPTTIRTSKLLFLNTLNISGTAGIGVPVSKSSQLNFSKYFIPNSCPELPNFQI
jgi:hypothetical protein